MTASQRTEDKALRGTEDKTLVGPDAPLVDGPIAAEDEKAKASEVKAASRGEDQGDIEIVYIHHRGDYVPGDTVKLPADRANRAIQAGVARLV